jgi:hypothetical protein
MATRIRTLDFLPEIFKTTTNSQFLSATLDQLVAQPNTKKIQGYVGSKFGYGVNPNDYYVTEPTKTRTDYQLEPGVIFLKENDTTAKDFISYPGIIDALKSQGGLTENNNRLFNSQFYSWDSFTNLDPIINFNQYYWLPEGPERVVVASNIVYNADNFAIQPAADSYLISSETVGTPSANPTLTLLRGGSYTFAVNQNTQFWIQGVPGITGYNNEHVQTRDVYGVTNNGATNGLVTFTVPQKNALDDFYHPGNNTVNVVSTKPFDEINGAFVNDIGGIDGVTALDGLTVMFYDTGVVNETGYLEKFYDQTLYDENGGVAYDTNTDYPGSSIYNNNFEGGFYTEVAATFYTISLLGSVDNPQIQLSVAGTIPTNQKITALSGLTWVNRNFYRSTIGAITLEPYNSAILDTLYYQDGTIPGRVGVINLIENNSLNQINVVTEILGKPNYTAKNGVVFTNGLKVLFQGDIYPESYNNVEYYVEGVGTAIELIPVTTLVSPGLFSEGAYIPFDTTSYDVGNYDSSLYVPVEPDYITIARNSINRNPWSRSNRWFHIDVINASANYNNNPELLTTYTQLGNKAKRPIIEFYPNLKLFNSGAVGKNPIDFIDTRTTDAFTNVAGQTNYYPDTAGYTNSTATIAPVTGSITKTATATIALSNRVYLNNVTGLNVNDTITFTGTAFGGISTNPTNNSNKYYILEISNANEVVISTTKQGAPVTLTTATGTMTATCYPYSTTITVPSTDVFGLFTVGQYITDSIGVLPSVAFVTAVNVVGANTVITVSWYNQSIITGTSVASVVTADTPLDNYALFEGSRVVFAADTDLNVRNKIYVSRFSVIDPGSAPVITLSEASDGLVLPDEQTAIYRGYNYKGKDFFFDGNKWYQGQQKTQLQQSPKFDIYDNNGISLGDRAIYVGTSFAGSTLFSYGIGTGKNDTVLGFPLRYSSVDNVGDISFDVTLNSDTFTYVNGTTSITENVNIGYVYNYDLNKSVIRQLGWQTAVSPSIQYQVFEFAYNAQTSTNTFTCDIAPIVATPTKWPLIQVYVDNIYLPKDQWTFTITDTTTTINIVKAPKVETTVQILILSDQISSTAYFQTPINLNNNPLNQALTTANIGDIRGQYQSIFYNNPNTSGQVFGPNNYRDLGNLVPWGNRIIQNSASLVLPGTFLRNQSHNLFESLLYNSRQYITFKTLLVDTVNNSDYSRILTPSQMLDDALDQINASHIDSQPFFWSDMLPSKAPYITNTYSFANTLDISVYPLSHIYNFSTANYNGVLVYLIRNGIQTQLVKGVDYTVSADSPSLTVTLGLQANDQIVIKEYNQTYGSYVPNTPTKLGLYPATIPNVTLDNAYNPETYFIVGHDGSFNKLYGAYDSTTDTLSDFRDQVLLEYETRVYNNLKLSETVPAGSYQGVVIPGFFRQTDYSYDEFLQIYSELFLNWVGQNRIDYKTQFYYKNNQFNYNYRDSGNKLNNQPIEQGYFRGAYLFFYDTSTPNETPWEMLGLANQPTWWTSRYGAAPYTSDNLVLWEDLEAGRVWNNGTPFIKPSYARPGLLSIIPVDSFGNLLSPFDSIVGNYDQYLFQRDWMVGDVGPAEFSYRRSSTWPFDLMHILAVTKPADFFNLGVDVDNYKYNIEFNQYLVNDRSHLDIGNVPIYGSGTPATSYINWIVDYEKQVGVNATSNITTLLNNIDVRLVYRMAGFSDKNLLKFYVEKSSANSNNSSLLIPDESYGLLLYENQPFDKIIYSGVVIQIIDNGYKIFGNSQTNAYFKILTPKYAGELKTITVEDLSVQVTNEFYDTIQVVPYGTEFYNVQQVAQFLISYGEYLQSQGVVYEEIENGIPVQWEQMIAEFLYWAQTGWDIGSITTINPSANNLTIDKESRIVQPLTLSQNNFVLNQDLFPISTSNLNIVRDGTAFTAKPLNVGDAISYGQFNISNIENGIVFDNVTLFNDIIYNLITGLRQYRIYVNGAITAEWNGNVDASGFILNQDNILEWNGNVKYTAGSIVKYKNKYWFALKIIQPTLTFNELDWKETPYSEIQKGLLPNGQTRAYESTLYYDINKANLENDADLLAFSLIGYRPRDYLALVDLTDVSQVNVYQNLIKNKGTLNAASAFKGANLPQGGIDYDIYQNWAIKSGEFGGILNNNFIEFRLNQTYLTGNPSIVGLTSGVDTPGVQQEVPVYSVFNYGRPITSPNILPTISDLQPSKLYPTAGYVNLNDVKMASYFYSGLGVAQNSAGTTIPIDQFYVRDYAWIADYQSTWQVYTPTSLGSIINAKNNLNNTVTITFRQAHNLKKYQAFAIANFDIAINNYYIVAAIIDPFNVIINLSLNPQIKNITGQGIGFKLQSQRVATAPEIGTLPLLDNEFNKLKVWVDTNNDGSWAVYRKSLNYQYNAEITKNNSETFGSAVAYSSSLGYLIGDSSAGEIYRYTYDSNSNSYIPFQTITNTASFGANISYADDLFVVSQPTGTPKVYIYQHIATLASNTLALYQTISAPGGVTTWGTSTAMSGDQNWLYISDIDNNNVYVYRKSAVTNLYEQVKILTVTGLAAGDNFGYSISTDYYGDTVVVGAPQQDYDVNTQNYGYTYIFNRTVQNFEAQSASQSYIPVTFALAWTPSTTTKTASAHVGNALTLNSVTSLAVDMPIVFTGSLFGGVSANTVYYIKTIVSNTITISLTRGGTTFTLSGANGTMSVVAQTEPLYVSVNGTIIADNYYSVVGSTLSVYSGITPTLNPGDILNVSGINFALAQTLTNQETPRVGVQFGLSTDTNTFANEILIGAPFDLAEDNNEGAVFRYTNGGERYGTIIGTTTCNITTPRTILLNGYKVVLPVGNASTVASLVNLISITNVQASAIDGKLIISLIDVNLGVAGNKLSLTVLDSATLNEMGVTLFKETQKIECPHPTGRTQFGTVVKFDKSNSGSFVASAPVGTRFSATTFDFTDDELDNDTIFDNNTTQWLDTFTNAGAVYMFDYLSTYNENINNIGQFVYAQSTNAQDLDYGAQPYYGSALDFNNNRVTVGTPNFIPTNNTNDWFGQVVTYVSTSSTPDWSVYRKSSDIVDINGIFNIQLFSATTNETLANLDYIDPLQGKLLGAVTENIDFVSNVDPASYTSTNNVNGGLVWGAERVGRLWFDTSTTRFMNYHQNDVNYNSQYWGRVFPGSAVSVYSWVTSNVTPSQYTGPGTPYDINRYSIRGIINAEGTITPVYFFWARNTSIVFTRLGKKLSDTTLQSYIAQPPLSGISYFTPLLPNVFGLYNCASYINATDTVLHIGYSESSNDSVAHNQYSLIREGYAEDFLNGVPGSGAAYQNHAAVGITEPIGLYNRMLDSMCGVDNAGGVVPDPLLPKAVQTGVLARPRQGFFYSRFGALKNYLQYANTVLAQFPILETRNSKFLYTKNPETYAIISAGNFNIGSQYTIETIGTTNFTLIGATSNTVGVTFTATGNGTGTGTATILTFEPGAKYDTTAYWNPINWWAPGYNDNTKSSLQVAIYADLATLSVPVGTIVTVAQNSAGDSETYIYVGNTVWTRIGLENGTIEFKSTLWDYAEAKLGFGDSFFDTTPFDLYPSEETRYIVRALNEEIYTNELLVFRNKSLILLFEYIQSETIESQNYLDWLNKTSFVDVSHTIRELIPLEVFRSDNQLFLEGYLNEVKPYHVVIKEFIFKYTRTDIFEGDITDFDLPAQFNSKIQQFVSPQLVYANKSGDNQYLYDDPIWQTEPYNQWYSNYGLNISGEVEYQISLLTSYMSLNSTSCYVDNVNGFPVTGTILIGTEYMSYANRNLATNELTGISRGLNGSIPTIHIPGEDIFIDLPPVLVLNEGRGYINPPRVTAYLPTVNAGSFVIGTTYYIITVGSTDFTAIGATSNTVGVSFIATGVGSGNGVASIYPAPRVPAQLEPVMSLGIVTSINVVNPGAGYAILPQILIEPAFSASVNSLDVNTLTNTIGISNPILQTGDLVIYSPAENSTAIGGLIEGQHYYVNLLEISPSPIFALYNSYLNAMRDHDRIMLTSQGTGNQLFSVTAIASCITSSMPTRENNIALRFDRTSYTSQVEPWTPGNFYGSFYAGTLNNSAEVSSSSILLESTSPPISQILASAHGVGFEILDTSNQQTLTWSSRTRNTTQTYSPTSLYPNAIRINPSTGGASVKGNIGSTIGFYVGMPIKFVGSIIGYYLSGSNYVYQNTTLVDGVTYYVKSLVKLPNPETNVMEDTGFTISATVDNNGNPGAVLPMASHTLTIVPAGLTLYVGELTNLAVLTLNYSGIRNATATTTGTNHVTVQLTPTGQDGTTGFYLGTPIFFTGNVFGGIVENEVYYVITVIDKETFTMSLDSIATTFAVTATSSSNNSISCVSTTGLSINDPIIFTGNTFGGIVAGVTYYVREIFAGNTSFSIAATFNGSVVTLSDDSGSCTLTSQVNALKLSSGTGSMVLNVGLPVSPGQINGQEFTFYETSIPYSNVSGSVSELLTRNISASLATVNRLCLKNGSSLTNIYNNLQFNIAAKIGGLTVAGEPYTINGSGTTTVTVSSTSGTGNWLTLPIATNPNLTDVLYVGMPIVFTGTSLGGVSVNTTYYVYTIDASPPSDTGRFTISATPTLDAIFPVFNGNGTMTGTGDPYLTISGGYSLINSIQSASITYANPTVITVTNVGAYTNGTAIKFDTYGSLPLPLNTETTYYITNISGNTFNIAYVPNGASISTISSGSGTHWVAQTQVKLTQTSVVAAQFEVNYILGGYNSVILSGGSGYAVNNIITIPGTSLGGATTANDLQLTVTSVDSSGAVLSGITTGTPGGTVNQYYLKVLSENQVGVYANPNLTVAVSGENFPYMGITSTTASTTNSSTDRITVTSSSDFNINDSVVFTGTVFGNVVLGQRYYILTKPTSTTVTISTSMGGSTFQLGDANGSMTMAKLGDFAFLPEPFYFNPSIVKYNNRLYQCIISNNDPDFIFGKWELLTSGDRRLNALDRIIGYYEPTVNMPGVDLTQLVSGITYPNSSYVGNAFAPADQYALDTVLTDQPFYPTGVDLKAIVWNGSLYIAGSDSATYAAFNVSADASQWTINKLSNQPLGITDLIYAGGNYIITTSNNATPILVSDNGYTWISNGTFTPFDGIPYDMGNFDVSSLVVPSLLLNGVAYHNGVYVAVGNNIVSSTDVYSWTQRFAFTNGLTNVFNGVCYASTSGYTGFIAIGLGQQAINGNPTNYAIIYRSTDGYTWSQVTFNATQLGFNSIASNSNTIVAVGDAGIIYSSFNATDWFVKNSTVSSKLLNIIWDNYNNQFIAVGENGTLVTGTSDGVTWTQQTTGVSSTLENVVWNNDLIFQQSTTITIAAPAVLTLKYALSNGSIVKLTTTGALPTGLSVGTTYYVINSSGTTCNLSNTLNGSAIITSGSQNGVHTVHSGQYVAVGLKNTILVSPNATNWIISATFETAPSTYTVQGDDFTEGYGPEELVAGVVQDTIMMTVVTRPGTNWDETVYQHVGYNVVSSEIVPTSNTQVQYSFNNLVTTPAQLAVFDLSYITGLSTSLYEGKDYTIDWVNKIVTLKNPVNYIAPGTTDRVRIDVYEVGNGDQLVKSNTENDPIRVNTETGFQEIYVDANYGASLYQGSGIIRPDTAPIVTTAIKTDSITNSITCTESKNFVLNSPIKFSGAVFGGIVEDKVYYVKTIGQVSNRITISETYNLNTGTAGETFLLTSDTGSMEVVISVGLGLPWTPPAVYHNGSLMVLGASALVIKTKAITNTVTTISTGGMIVNSPIVFSNTIFGGVIVPQKTYYIKHIVDGNEFTISETPGGNVVVLTNATGGATFVTNDFAIGLSDNGITAAIIFANKYDTTVDYITYSLFGETLPIQYGYTIPQVELFTGNGSAASFDLNNYVGEDNPTNAIVEINGVRQTESAYSINALTNSILFYSPPPNGSTIAVTTYNQTARQYLNTQYSITGATGSALLSITVGSTTHLVSTFDQNTPTVNTFDENSPAIVAFDQELNYLSLASGSTSSLTINSPIIFSNVIGGIVAGQIYYITGILSSTDFTVSTTVGGLPTVVTTATGTMTGVVNGITVANIVNINNVISPPVVVNISGTQSSNNYVICANTLNMIVGQPIVIKAPIFTAGSFTNTKIYQIVSLGNTNWNAIGAGTTPYVGQIFTATGAGSGTGTALLANVGGIDTTGQVYFVRSIPDSTHFTIKDQFNNVITLSNATETLIGYVGGSTTARITTGIPHNLTTNEIVRIDGVLGSVQLNNNTYYVHVISNTQLDIFTQPYNPALYAVNYPVDYLAAYVSGGYVWLDQLFTIVDTTATTTTANGNRITVNDTNIIVPNTPILFTKVGTNVGDNILGGILAKTQYYVYSVRPEVEAGNFITGNEYEITILGSTDWNTAAGTSAITYAVGDTFIAANAGTGTGFASGLQEFTITENRYPNQAEVDLVDATGLINVTEFEQANVDRLWVTVNGYRVPSSSLRMNPYNNLSILTTIQTGDQIIITSMIPTATPNQETYLLNVTTKNEPAVFRSNVQTRTWLTKGLNYTDQTIYLNDLTRVTDNVVQNVTCPAAVDGKYNIGLTSDKNVICHITVYNNTTSTTVNPANFKIIIVDAAPILQISGQVSVGDSLTITSVVGRLLYINGEQIGFGECDLALNTVSQLSRGANGTGVQNYIPKYSEVYGLIPGNMMSDVLYAETWNPIPGVYNTVEGDPLQIADTQGATFLRTDRN